MVAVLFSDSNKPTQLSLLSHIAALPLPQAHFCSKLELIKNLPFMSWHQSNSRGFDSSAPDLPSDSVTYICILSPSERAGVGLSPGNSAPTSFQCRTKKAQNVCRIFFPLVFCSRAFSLMPVRLPLSYEALSCWSHGELLHE